MLNRGGRTGNKNKNFCEYIYLIREREFAESNKPIYKIGKTVNLYNRMNQYPKRSEIYLFEPVDDSNWYEKELLSIFENMYERARVSSGEIIGNEYFVGNVNEMIYVIRSFIMNHYPGKINTNLQSDSYDYDSEFEPYSNDEYEYESNFYN